jgi:hypothetical protein
MRYDMFNDLKVAYFLGMGIDENFIGKTLILDFINIYIISLYVLIFRNPIIMKRVKKVFWQFPSLDDAP